MHLLKIEPEPFREILNGDKRHEVRKCQSDDEPEERLFQIGDTLFLCEYGREQNEFPSMGPYDFTGRFVVAKVTNVTRAEHFGLPAGLCCMTIKSIDEDKVPG